MCFVRPDRSREGRVAVGAGGGSTGARPLLLGHTFVVHGLYVMGFVSDASFCLSFGRSAVIYHTTVRTNDTTLGELVAARGAGTDEGARKLGDTSVFGLGSPSMPAF